MGGICYVNGDAYGSGYGIPVQSAKQCAELVAATKPAPKKAGLFDNVRASGNLGPPAGLAACTGKIEPDEAIAEAKEESVTSNNSIMLEEQDINAIYDELGYENVCTPNLRAINLSDPKVQQAIAQRVIEKYMKEDESFPKLNDSAKKRAIAALAKEIEAKHGADTLYNLIVIGQDSYGLFCHKYPSGQPPVITALTGITPAKVKEIAQNSLAIITGVSPAKIAEGATGKEVIIVGNNLPTDVKGLEIAFSCTEVAPDLDSPAAVQSVNNLQTIKKVVDVVEIDGDQEVPCDVTVKQCQSVFTVAHPINPNATLNDVLCEEVTLKGAITITPVKVDAPAIAFKLDEVDPASGKQGKRIKKLTIRVKEGEIPEDIQEDIEVTIGEMELKITKVTGRKIVGELKIPRKEAPGDKDITIKWGKEDAQQVVFEEAFEVLERKGGGKKAGKPAQKTAKTPKKPKLPACSTFPASQQKLKKFQGKCQ